MNQIHPDSVLFITLDSCRFDSFLEADTVKLSSVGVLRVAQAPSYFTYGSHCAMFVGFTPGVTTEQIPLLNPKAGKVFKIVGTGFPSKGEDAFTLNGRNIIDGFNRLRYRTIGTGAVSWFDPATPSGRVLTRDFRSFFYSGNTHSLSKQIHWIDRQLKRARGPAFVFLNVGETHVPYYYEGAPWSMDDSPCIPFQLKDRARECRERQIACIKFVNSLVGPILDSFARATILVCGDHGDCWGEDGLWEHGISHPMTLAVPHLLRVRGEPV